MRRLYYDRPGGFEFADSALNHYLMRYFGDNYVDHIEDIIALGARSLPDWISPILLALVKYSAVPPSK